jgi:hypothetical protein
VTSGSRTLPVYVFRDQSFSGGGDTVVCAAPAELVVTVFGGGGLYEGDGLAAHFEGCAAFRDEITGETFLGVWGARKASRFRNRLRTSGASFQIRHERPPCRLILKSYGRLAAKRV